ncbi:MAG TPA: PilZ domain-containing protein, partial [Thermoanaerobaculia bacterium]|nr:PilZ domain-containing protein [Thermoanaerobaculia bacterium]
MSEPDIKIVVADRDPAGVSLEGNVHESSALGAASGQEALLRIRADQPQLVLFSFELEDMTGAEFCRLVRADKEMRTTSLLFMTRKGQDEEIDLCMAAGCNDIIFRPLDPAELQAKMRMYSTIPLRKELRTLAKVEIMAANQSIFLFGQSVNVSSKGMLLEIERLLPPEAVVRVTFFLPDDPTALKLEAQVFRAEFGDATPRYGLQFLDISDAERERIDQYVQRLHS